MQYIKELLKNSARNEQEITDTIEYLDKFLSSKYDTSEADLIRYQLKMEDEIESKDGNDIIYYFKKIKETKKDLLVIAELKEFLSKSKN